MRLIQEHRVTHAQFVPTMFVRMLKLPEAVRDSYDVSSLRCVIHAAAPCPVDVKHQMMEWFGPIIHEYYGGTEGFAGSHDRPRGMARAPRLGRQAVQPGPRGLRGRHRASGRGVRRAVLRGWPEVRVLQGSREDGVGVERARVAIAGRHGLSRRGRLSLPHRPLDVHDRLRWGEHLSAGGGEPPDHASQARRRRGVRRAQRRVRRRGQGRRATRRGRSRTGPIWRPS